MKSRKFVCDPKDGICRMAETGNEEYEPSLSDEQARELGRMAMRLEEHHRCPQDIEWAIGRSGRITLLQCRRLQQKASHRQATGLTGGEGLPGALLRSGITASPGVAAGPIFKVRKYKDSLRFPKGAILVTRQALPRWASSWP